MTALEAASGDLAALAQRDEYLWLPGLIPEQVAQALGAEVMRQVEAGTDWLTLSRQMLPSAAFDRIRRHPALMSVLEQVAGAVEAQQGDVLRVVRPGDEPTPAHRDADYTAADLWTAWMPLVDCSLDRGPLAVMAKGQSGEWRSAAMRPGDVVLFHALTLHCALPNRSSTVRISMDCRYRPVLPGRVFG